MDKKALVVGASGGIGTAIARRFLKDGMQVWGTYHQDVATIDTLKSEAKDRFFSGPMDCTQEDSVRKAMTAILNEFKTLDVLVYAVAPAITYSSVLKSEWKNFQKHLEIQLKGFLLIIQALQPQFQNSHKTKIITILSEYCTGKPATGISDYISAKYALMGLSKSLAVELARYHSTVNMISPGMTETELIASLPPKAVEFAALNNPMQRIAVPQDIAGAASFLASDQSDYLNGVNLLINGGGVMI